MPTWGGTGKRRRRHDRWPNTAKLEQTQINERGLLMPSSGAREDEHDEENILRGQRDRAQKQRQVC